MSKEIINGKNKTILPSLNKNFVTQCQFLSYWSFLLMQYFVKHGGECPDAMHINNCSLVRHNRKSKRCDQTIPPNENKTTKCPLCQISHELLLRGTFTKWFNNKKIIHPHFLVI